MTLAGATTNQEFALAQAGRPWRHLELLCTGSFVRSCRGKSFKLPLPPQSVHTMPSTYYVVMLTVGYCGLCNGVSGGGVEANGEQRSRSLASGVVDVPVAAQCSAA